MSKRKRMSLLLTVALLAVSYLVYSRPMTIAELYPMLTPERCTEIRGTFHAEDMADTGFTYYSYSRDSEEFDSLWDLLYERSYRRSLRDLVPRGARVHQSNPNQYDFQWEAIFLFEDVAFPDGSMGSGALLSIQSWYGELDIYFTGERYSCRTGDQDLWAREVLDVLRTDPGTESILEK